MRQYLLPTLVILLGATAASAEEAGAPAGADPGAPPATQGSAPAADSADPTPEQENGPHVVHADLREGFELESKDGKQSLRIGGLFSGRATVSHADGDDTNIDGTIRLARLMTRGRLLGPELTYFFQGEFAGNPRLLDMELTYSPADTLTLRFGRLRVPFGREWITGLNTLMFPDRSVVSDAFRPGRDTGVTAESRLLDGKMEARLGAYGEDGDRWPLAIARLAFAPLGALAYSEDANEQGGPPRFAIGLNGSYDKKTPTQQVVDLTTGEIVTQPQATRERIAGGVDLGFRAGGFAAFAEAYVDRIDAVGAPAVVRAGTFAQAGYFVIPSRFEVAGRFSLLAPDVEDTHADGLQRYELGLSYYLFDGALKIQGRYAYDRITGGATGLPFPQGHIGDAQFVLSL